jgi:hypothetical protein
MDKGNRIVKEFKLFPDVIDREARDSFRIKGWTVTLVVVAIVSHTSNFSLFGALLPLVGIWWLDAYYLRQENMYSEICDCVREKRSDDEEYRFDLDASQFEDEVCTVREATWSPTIPNSYGVIAVLPVLYVAYVLVLQGVIVNG